MAFRLADDVLRQGIQGISELITQPGLINVDFAHIRQMMQTGGGSSSRSATARVRTKLSKRSTGRSTILCWMPSRYSRPPELSPTSPPAPGLTFLEVAGALSYLQNKTNNQAEIIPGVINDERMEDRVQVILVITGLGATPVDASQP